MRQAVAEQVLAGPDLPEVSREVSRIRNATASDIPRIVAMGRKFRAESSYENKLRENPDQMGELALKMINLNGLLLSERAGKITGMLAFFVYPHFISGDMVAGEVVWWVEPLFRGDGLRLLHEMEKRAKAGGAKFMQMIAPCARVAELYKRLGYEWVEATYQKRI